MYRFYFSSKAESFGRVDTETTFPGKSFSTKFQQYTPVKRFSHVNKLSLAVTADDGFTYSETNESSDGNIFAKSSNSFSDQVPDTFIRILNKRLLNKTYFLKVFLYTTFNNFFNYIIWFSRFFSLANKNLFFLLY